MPPLDAIADAGGWAVCVFTLLLVVLALLTGRLVPGPIHARDVARAERLEAEAVSLVRRTRSLERGLDRCRSALAAAKRRPSRARS